MTNFAPDDTTNVRRDQCAPPMDVHASGERNGD
jgi:hypothetical protein